MAGIEMKVLKTYDGTEGFKRAGETVTVSDKQRAAFLQDFKIAEPVDKDLELEVVSYTDEELKDMKQADLRAVAKKLDVEGAGRMTNDELRANIKAKQSPAPEQETEADAEDEAEGEPADAPEDTEE